MEGELKSFIKVLISIMASLLYSYFIASKIPKGKFRFFSLLPIFSLFAVLPLSLSTVFLTGTVTFFITWLTTYKLLLFSFNLGPLVSDPPLKFPLFASIACLPIKIKPKKTDPDHKNLKKIPNPKLPLNLPAKIVIFAGFIAAGDHIDRLRPNAKICVYSVLLYFFVDILLGVPSVFFQLMFGGVELEPGSNEPYLMTSLQDFWGRRWNLLVSNSLRYSVYKPVQEAVEGLIGPTWAAGVAVMAVFVVSGVMHEQMVYYLTREFPTWETTWFLVVQGVCVVVESGLKAAVGRRWRPPSVVAGLLTLAVLMVTAAWLFFPPFLKAGTFESLLRELKMVGKFLWKLI
ncbi:Acyl-CoA--sterol O-acyltransferase 1, partial [Cucurbita argyrosperma subsp. sororia]